MSNVQEKTDKISQIDEMKTQMEKRNWVSDEVINQPKEEDWIDFSKIKVADEVKEMEILEEKPKPIIKNEKIEMQEQSSDQGVKVQQEVEKADEYINQGNRDSQRKDIPYTDANLTSIDQNIDRNTQYNIVRDEKEMRTKKDKLEEEKRNLTIRYDHLKERSMMEQEKREPFTYDQRFERERDEKEVREALAFLERNIIEKNNKIEELEYRLLQIQQNSPSLTDYRRLQVEHEESFRKLKRLENENARMKQEVSERNMANQRSGNKYEMLIQDKDKKIMTLMKEKEELSMTNNSLKQNKEAIQERNSYWINNQERRTEYIQPNAQVHQTVRTEYTQPNVQVNKTVRTVTKQPERFNQVRTTRREYVRELNERPQTIREADGGKKITYIIRLDGSTVRKETTEG